MASAERIESWQASVVRCGLAARALNATIALYHSSGPDAAAAWKAVEATRTAFSKATAREGEQWRLANGPDAQQAMPGMEAPGPRGRRGTTSAARRPARTRRAGGEGRPEVH